MTRPARPWDVLNPNIQKVSGEIKRHRLDLCESCDEFLPTRQCGKCMCFMDIKTQLPHAGCPLGKWGVVQTDTTA